MMDCVMVAVSGSVALAGAWGVAVFVGDWLISAGLAAFGIQEG